MATSIRLQSLQIQLEGIPVRCHCARCAFKRRSHRRRLWRVNACMSAFLHPSIQAKKPFKGKLSAVSRRLQKLLAGGNGPMELEVVPFASVCGPHQDERGKDLKDLRTFLDGSLSPEPKEIEPSFVDSCPQASSPFRPSIGTLSPRLRKSQIQRAEKQWTIEETVHDHDSHIFPDSRPTENRSFMGRKSRSPLAQINGASGLRGSRRRKLLVDQRSAERVWTK